MDFAWARHPGKGACPLGLHNEVYNYAMERTTIMADKSTVDGLRRQARERGVSFAVVVREALEEKALSYRPKPASLGAGQSAPSRTAASKGSHRQPPRSWR